MTIGEEVMKTGGEETMEIMADEAALEGGAGFEGEEVFVGVSGAAEEDTVEGGKSNHIQCLFDQQSNMVFIRVHKTLETDRVTSKSPSKPFFMCRRKPPLCSTDHL